MMKHRRMYVFELQHQQTKLYVVW